MTEVEVQIEILNQLKNIVISLNKIESKLIDNNKDTCKIFYSDRISTSGLSYCKFCGEEKNNHYHI